MVSYHWWWRQETGKRTSVRCRGLHSIMHVSQNASPRKQSQSRGFPIYLADVLGSLWKQVSTFRPFHPIPLNRPLRGCVSRLCHPNRAGRIGNSGFRIRPSASCIWGRGLLHLLNGQCQINNINMISLSDVPGWAQAQSLGSGPGFNPYIEMPFDIACGQIVRSNGINGRRIFTVWAY